MVRFMPHLLPLFAAGPPVWTWLVAIYVNHAPEIPITATSLCEMCFMEERVRARASPANLSCLMPIP
uniref:Putative secreted protein n=1 Tax=Anopheles darlingi TaxID=43151 RepID=A0A2M4DRI1_ANODA